MTVKEKAKEQMPLPLDYQINEMQAIKDYVLAGNSKFTLRSVKSGRHLTFRVRDGGNKDIRFVSRLVEGGYEYIGIIDTYNSFTWTRGVPIRLRTCDHYKAFRWFWAKLNMGKLDGQMEFYHSGKCGKCGRELTDPVSINAGYGPECRKTLK